MLLVDKNILTENLFDSNVVITSLEEDKEYATKLMNEFNYVGLNYAYLEKSQNVHKDFWYWRACEESIKKAGCLVIVLSKKCFDKANSERTESFWFEAGYMESKGLSIIPYIVDIPRAEWDVYLNKTPIRQIQATDDIANLISRIEQTRSFKKSFFKDREVAFYGNSRVFYSKLSVLFTLKKEYIDKIFDRLQKLEIAETRLDTLQKLQREINFGVRLFRFGRDCFTEHPYYRAYNPESEILNMDCNPINSYNRFNILSQNASNGSCTIKVDFIIPNHEIFGVAIKPYLEVNFNSFVGMKDLKELLKNDVEEEVFETKLEVKEAETDKTRRIYFNFYFDDDTNLMSCQDEVIGNSCNFFYAK